MLLLVVSADGLQVGELADQPVDVAADGVGQQASDPILTLHPQCLPDAVLQCHRSRKYVAVGKC
jgi:hypothetical protein